MTSSSNTKGKSQKGKNPGVNVGVNSSVNIGVIR